MNSVPLHCGSLGLQLFPTTFRTSESARKLLNLNSLERSVCLKNFLDHDSIPTRIFLVSMFSIRNNKSQQPRPNTRLPKGSSVGAAPKKVLKQGFRMIGGLEARSRSGFQCPGGCEQIMRNISTHCVSNGAELFEFLPSSTTEPRGKLMF